MDKIDCSGIPINATNGKRGWWFCGQMMMHLLAHFRVSWSMTLTFRGANPGERKGLTIFSLSVRTLYVRLEFR